MRVTNAPKGQEVTHEGKAPHPRADRAQLHDADRLIAEGKSMAVVLKQLGVSEQTYYRWRKAYGELSPDEARRLRELEAENKRLKKIVADKELELDVMREIARGNF